MFFWRKIAAKCLLVLPGRFWVLRISAVTPPCAPPRDIQHLSISFLEETIGDRFVEDVRTPWDRICHTRKRPRGDRKREDIDVR